MYICIAVGDPIIKSGEG